MFAGNRESNVRHKRTQHPVSGVCTYSVLFTAQDRSWNVRFSLNCIVLLPVYRLRVELL